MKKLILSCLAFGIVGYTGLAIGYSAQTPVPVQANSQAIIEPEPVAVTQDPVVASLMEQLGISYGGLNLIYGDNPNLPNTKASFTQPNSIYLTPLMDRSEQLLALSHEYIHYAQIIDHQNAQSFYPYLRELQASNSWLAERMKVYDYVLTCSDCLPIEAETQAVACTEMTDQRLRADFVAWCNKHLPFRYSL
jgi:hypothetical protein